MKSEDYQSLRCQKKTYILALFLPRLGYHPLLDVSLSPWLIFKCILLKNKIISCSAPAAVIFHAGGLSSCFFCFSFPLRLPLAGSFLWSVLSAVHHGSRFEPADAVQLLSWLASNVLTRRYTSKVGMNNLAFPQRRKWDPESNEAVSLTYIRAFLECENSRCLKVSAKHLKRKQLSSVLLDVFVYIIYFMFLSEYIVACMLSKQTLNPLFSICSSSIRTLKIRILLVVKLNKRAKSNYYKSSTYY